MHLVIDGYNLLYKSWFEDRDQLIDFLSDYKKSKQIQKITLVFDGTHKGTSYGDQQFYGGIEIIYSPLNETADEVIERIAPGILKDHLVIVSSDRRVQKAATREGGTFLESQEFVQRLKTYQKDLFLSSKHFCSSLGRRQR